MAEIEVHPAHEHDADPLARRAGMMVGVIGITLAVVTIAAHREHTAAVIHRTEANDQWAYYQAKKIREHVSDVGSQLAALIGTDATRTAAAVGKLEASKAKYTADAEGIRKEAEAKDHQTEHAEHLALCFDLGEGFLELGLVLTSLYFLGKRRVFPVAGGISALIGATIALLAALLAPLLAPLFAG